MVKRVLDFVSTGQDTTGKTPSFQATLKGDTQKIRYQIKRSNYINRLRRWVGLDHDQSDILGEYIASRVTASLLNKNPPPDLAPEVDLVYNEEHNDFSLASKYLNDRDQRFHGMTLGELIEDKDALQVQEIKNTTDKYFNESRALLIGILNKMRPIKSSSPKEKNLYKEAENSIRNLDVIFHKIEENRNTQIEVPYEKRRKKTKLVFGKASNNQLSIDKPFKTQIDGQTETISINKPELYNALASSIILGDHDINPNNFYAIFDKKTKEMHIGRIDLGHAFN